MRHRSTLTRWLTLWVMVLSVLTPTASHIGAASLLDGQFVSICTRSGIQWVAVDEGPADSEGAQSHLNGLDCPLCLLHAQPVLPEAVYSRFLPQIFTASKEGGTGYLAWALSASTGLLPPVRAPPPFI